MAIKCHKCHHENPDDTIYCGKCTTPLKSTGEISVTKTLITPKESLQKGSTIAGRYTIIEELGKGGMGVVYKAEDTKLKRTVALKFLPPELTHIPEFHERFTREAQAAAALSHPNICVVHEIGEGEDRPFIAMEYVEGETLRDRIRKKDMTTEEALAISIQVASGLGEAHSKGIVHRDVKSTNIMVTPKGRVKVMDFGLAKLRSGLSLTRSRTTLGTIAYMSPEQAKGEQVDGRTDIWSLGIVLYEMLTGELPFKGDHDQAVIHAILHREPASLKKAKPDAPSGLEEVIFQALAKKPSARYPTMEELAEDLEAVAEGLKPLKARPARAIKLAVLPFANLSGDPDQEYLSDGLTQEMITELGRLHPESLSVIARTSVMRYKKGDTPVDQIGQELGVNYVLEGSTLREANLIRINSVLIQVADQTQLWADSYKREFSGILALQSEVAESVAKALSLKLLPSEKDMLARAHPIDPEAHEAYLRGINKLMNVTPEDIDTAEKYFDQALEKDPSFASAYAGRAQVWVIRNQMGMASPEEAAPKAKAAALRALELDANSADAHHVLASVKTYIDWDWEGAGESWERTLELNPNIAGAQVLYAHFLAITGHVEEARVHSEKAAVLDPFDPLIQCWHAQILLVQRRYDEAMAVAREAQRIHPDHPIVGFTLWVIMHEKKEMEEAFEAIKAVMVANYQDPRVEAALEEGYAHGGYAEAMKRGAESLIARLPEAFSLPNDIGNFYMAAGEKDKAIEWLEKGFEVHDPVSPYLSCFPIYDDIRSDPRIQEVLRKMNLPVDEKE
jgi:serine/threonine protein kinase/Tfp pilus assembly protein PilF